MGDSYGRDILGTAGTGAGKVTALLKQAATGEETATNVICGDGLGNGPGPGPDRAGAKDEKLR